MKTLSRSTVEIKVAKSKDDSLRYPDPFLIRVLGYRVIPNSR